MRSVLNFINKNQITLTRNLIVGLYLVDFVSRHRMPQVHAITSKFLHLQYLLSGSSKGASYTRHTNHTGCGLPPAPHFPDSPQYGIGADDAYFVAYSVVVITFWRAILMKYLFDPLALHVFQILLRKARVRFAEQSWAAVYYGFSFIFGFCLYYHSPYWSNIENIFVGWPHSRLAPWFKIYYLVMIAFWLQQLLVLNIEAERKDHYQMFCHHIVTCLLVIGSYYYYFTRIGNLIACIMDSVDILLSTAKILKYLRYSNACDAMFGLFTLAWIVLRHGVYNYLFYVSWTKSLRLMADTMCEPGLEFSQAAICWTPRIVHGFLALLGGLQILSLIWLYMIGRVVFKVIKGQNAEDVRSDEDDTDEETPANDLLDSTEFTVFKEKLDTPDAHLLAIH